MTTHLSKAHESKAANRRKLAELPIGEKLRLLDAMRESAIAIRNATPQPDSCGLREAPVPYRITPNPRNV